MSLSLVNNRQSYNIVNNSDQESLASSLNLYSINEAFELLVSHYQKKVDSPLYNAFASRLCKDFSSLKLEQLIKITEIYVKANSTHSILKRLLDAFNQDQTMSLPQLISLFVICQELEALEAELPPNQVLVNFLKILKSKLLTLLGRNEFVAEMQNGVKDDKYDEQTNLAVLDGLLHLGKIKKSFTDEQLLRCCRMVESKYLNRYDYDISFYLKIHKLIALFLSKLDMYTRDSFYKEDSLYTSCVPKIQLWIGKLNLKDVSDVVESCARGRLRDGGFFRTLARRAMQLASRDVNTPDQTHQLVNIFESYAQLNINNPPLFALFYRKVVVDRIALSPADAVRALFGTAIHGLIGTAKAEVRTIVSAVSPYVDTTISNEDLLKLVVMKRFVVAYYPTPQAFSWVARANGSNNHPSGTISPEQQKVSDFLTTKGIKNVCETFIPDYPFPIDIVAYKAENPRLKSDTIIEVDGPQHYDISGMKLRGKDVLKNYVLSGKWKVVRLPVQKIEDSRLNKLVIEIQN